MPKLTQKAWFGAVSARKSDPWPVAWQGWAVLLSGVVAAFLGFALTKASAWYVVAGVCVVLVPTIFLTYDANVVRQTKLPVLTKDAWFGSGIGLPMPVSWQGWGLFVIFLVAIAWTAPMDGKAYAHAVRTAIGIVFLAIVYLTYDPDY